MSTREKEHRARLRSIGPDNTASLLFSRFLKLRQFSFLRTREETFHSNGKNLAENHFWSLCPLQPTLASMALNRKQRREKREGRYNLRLYLSTSANDTGGRFRGTRNTRAIDPGDGRTADEEWLSTIPHWQLSKEGDTALMKFREQRSRFKGKP